MDRGPIGIAIERPPLIERQMISILDIGYELGAFGRHHRLHFRSNHVSCCFEFGKPGKISTRMEFAFGDFGIKEMGRLAVVRASAAQRVVAEPRNAVAFVIVAASFAGGGRRFQSILAFIQPGGVPRLALGDDGSELFGEIARWSLRQCMAPGFACTRVFEPIEQGRTHYQRGKIKRGERQRTVHRLERDTGLASGAAHPRQPQLNRRIIGGRIGCLPQQCLGLRQIARRQRPVSSRHQRRRSVTHSV